MSIKQLLKTKFKRGVTVRLKASVKHHTCPEGRKNHRTAKVCGHMDQNTYEGGIITDRDLRGCRYWNIEDLEIVEEEYESI